MFGEIYSSSSYGIDGTLPSVPILLNGTSWSWVHLQRSHGFRAHDWDELLSTSLRLTLKRERTASGKPPQGSAENPSLPAGEFPKFPVACAQATGPVRPCSSKLQRPSCRAAVCRLRGSKLWRLASQPSRGLNGSRNSAPTVQPGLQLPLAPALHSAVAIATPRVGGIDGFKVPDPGQTKGSLSSLAPALLVTMITTTLGCSAWPSWPLQVSLPGSPGPKEANFSELL